FVAVSGNVLPASDGNVHYSIVPAGTYTQSGGSDVVVSEGNLGIIADDGTSWSLVNMVELPTVTVDENINPLSNNAISNKAVASQITFVDGIRDATGNQLFDNNNIEVGSYNNLGQATSSTTQKRSKP